MFEKLKEENDIIRSIREDIRELKNTQVGLEFKLKCFRKGTINDEEILMSEEDKLEMDANCRKLNKQMRSFQRAIKICRDKWSDLKTSGKVKGEARTLVPTGSSHQSRILTKFRLFAKNQQG